MALFYKNDFIGWSFGFQESIETYYMCNSAILPDHRRKGLYTKLVETTLEIVKEIGFQTIYSRHTTTNSAVIIPKLKAGFLITHFELSDKFGSLIHLTYFTKEVRRKILDYRAGQTKPDDEIKSLLGI